MKGIVEEGENVSVIYIDGKPAAKYVSKYEAEKDANYIRERFPNRSIEVKQEVHETELDENLHKWFKEKWVRFGPDGKIRGSCARGDDSEGKPKCLPQSKAHSLGKKGRKYAASKKRREDPNPERRGPAKNVATKKKTNESIPFNECPECRGPIVHESMMNEKQDACYHKVKARYKVWPSAYASGALVQCRKKGASNWGNSKKNESSVMKGIVDEAGSPAQQAAIAINMKKHHKKPKNEGVIIGHDKDDPQVAVLGGAGSYTLSNLKKKAQMEANELAKDIANGEYKNSAYNVKQLANTLNTIVAAEEEMQKLYFGEDSDMRYASEKTPAINPYGGQKDRKFRGAIAEALLSEMPTDNITGSSGEGGWRKYKAKSAGRLDETQYEYDADELSNLLSDYYVSKPKRDPSRGIARRIMNALHYYKGRKVTRAELLRTPGMGKQGMVLIDTLLGRTTPSTDPYSYYQSQIIEFAEHLKTAISKKDIRSAEDLLSNLKSALNALKRSKPVSEDTSYAGGMGQGGNAGQSYRKFKPKVAGTFEDKKPDFMKAGNMKPFTKSGEEIPGSVKALEKLLLTAKERGIELNYYSIDKMMQAVAKKHHLTGDELHNEFVAKHHMIPDNWIVKQLDEACWKGYHKEGMKTMFGKKYPNCVKNTKESTIMKGLKR
jgi:hypothetical protein